ncbi:MAG: DUF1343 domain-containing protein [Gemmatimonadota bacterium]|jgi:uncharacterized protein YbbC (DUF1343 family)|nr:DUF1343 domain-containing protein [Gemmatimonadota bacterium]
MRVLITTLSVAVMAVLGNPGYQLVTALHAGADVDALQIPSSGASPAGESGEALTSPGTASGNIGEAVSVASAREGVITGAEILLRDSLHLVRGKRIGLITNPTALTHDGKHTIDLLAENPEVKLQVLFAPEHGLRGGMDAGAHIANGTDLPSGLPVRSLYGETMKPTREMLRDVDILVFDMLDISARTYTYIWTMTLAMEAAAEAGIPFLVLDRPNPVTGKVGGPLPSMSALRTGPRITGHWPVPFRHGMTPGEIARYANGEFGVGASLTVVPVEGWHRTDWYDGTGLPWVNPSPNIRSLDAALNFTGLGSLEATSLSLGRGTDEPFTVVGAPWLDTDALLQRLSTYSIPGAVFEATRFVPSGDGWMQFRGTSVKGVRIRILDRDLYDPSFVSLVLLAEVYRLHPRQLGMNSMKHVMDDSTAEEIRRGVDPVQIAARWRTEDEAWQNRTAMYRLYQ